MTSNFQWSWPEEQQYGPQQWPERNVVRAKVQQWPGPPASRAVLSVVTVKGHNFTFRCHIKRDCCDYIAEKKFADCVRNKSFILSDDDDDDDDEDDDDDYDEKKRENEENQMTPAIFVMMTSKIIQEIIKNSSYRVHQQFDPKKGIIFVFAHQFLTANCTLKLSGHDFKRNITDIDDNNLKPLVIKLLNEIEELKQELKVASDNNQCETISRREFIRSQLWDTSPFDICYDVEDIFDENGYPQKWVIDAAEKPSNKEQIKMLNVSVKEKNDIKAFANKTMIHHQHIDNSNLKMVRFFDDKNSKIIYLPDINPDQMRIVCIDNNYYLKGAVWIKLADVKGGLLRLQGYPYNKSRSVAKGVVLESFNKLIFGAKQRVIGITKRFSKNVKSHYFWVRFSSYSTNGKSIDFAVMYQVAICNKVIYLNFIQAFEGNRNIECKNKFNGYLGECCNLGLTYHYAIHMSNDGRKIILNLRLF